MAWRVAESLEVLRRQLNLAYPKRSKASDGGIGDAAHQSSASDHNPWVKYKGKGIVTARDFTHDPANGLDCNQLANALVVNRDPRVKYIIWNRRMCSSYPAHGHKAWSWRSYSGKNAHTHHLHLSVQPEPALFDSSVPWKLSASVPADSINPPAVQDRTTTQPAKPTELMSIYHTVVKGDTLSGLAKKYDESIEAIKCFNGLTSDVIRLGQKLRVK
jgi:hypothetical protein